MNIDKLCERASQASAIKDFDTALKLIAKIKKVAPNYVKAHLLEAGIWQERDNFVKFHDALQKFLPFPENPNPEMRKYASEILFNLGVSALDLGFIEKACVFYLQSAKFAENIETACNAISNALFSANYSEYFTAADFHVLYDEYNKYLPHEQFPRKFYHHKKVRVGFLSADFRAHALVAWSWALLNGLDRRFFEVYYYANVEKPDKVTESLRKDAYCWRDILSLNDEDAAKLIRDDEIDILLDLNGYTGANRLRVMAYHPASIQICGVGYMNSTGLDCFDYFLSDVYCTEKVVTVSDYFNEKVIRLPQSHICHEPLIQAEPVTEPPCLKNGYVTFGTFNQYRKFTDSMLRTWKRILDAVPDSRLLLKHRIFSTLDGKKFVRERLKRLGIDPKRVEMRGFSGNHLAHYADMDIALDTFPYTGGVTTCDALYMCVPVISLYGDRPGSRFGYSLLKNIGLDELAVETSDDYVNRAVALAGDWELLTVLRKNLRTMMKNSPVMDSANYVRAIEKTFAVILDSERKEFEQTT